MLPEDSATSRQCYLKIVLPQDSAYKNCLRTLPVNLPGIFSGNFIGNWQLAIANTGNVLRELSNPAPHTCLCAQGQSHQGEIQGEMTLTSASPTAKTLNASEVRLNHPSHNMPLHHGSLDESIVLEQGGCLCNSGQSLLTDFVPIYKFMRVK